jgi:hypothetical protein
VINGLNEGRILSGALRIVYKQLEAAAGKESKALLQQGFTAGQRSIDDVVHGRNPRYWMPRLLEMGIDCKKEPERFAPAPAFVLCER